MRILHTAGLLAPPLGVVHQMSWEQLAADRLGLDWRARVFCPEGSLVNKDVAVFSHKTKKRSGANNLLKIRDWVMLRWEYHCWLKSQESVVDVFLLRHYVHDPFQWLFMVRCRKPIYLIHHTLEVPELASENNIRGKLRANIERVVGKYCIRKSKRTIGVTREIVDYELKRASQGGKSGIVYSNGVLYSEQSALDRRSDVPELIFVAGGFVPWHGLDLLLAAMQINQDNFILHLVGDVGQDDLSVAKKDKRIILHGKKTQKEIRDIAAACWAGISSFGLFRKNMKQACTLKVREYLMLGLPVYSGHEDVFSKEFRFYTWGDANISDILKFARSCRNERRESVSDAARPYIDKTELVRGLFEEIAGSTGISPCCNTNK